MHKGKKKEEKKINSTGHAYMIVSDKNTGDVLYGKKRDRGKWFNRDVSQARQIANNQGQFVFPGGELEGVPFTPDNVRDAAIREFRQETGLNVDLPNKSIVREWKQKPPMPPALLKIFDTRTIKGAGPYGALHVRAEPMEGSNVGLAALMDAFAKMAQEDNRIYQSRGRNDKILPNLNITDDELASLHSLDRVSLGKKFKAIHNPASDKTSTEWFSNLLGLV